MKEEDNITQEEPMLISQPLLTSPRGLNNVANSPSSEFKHIET